MCSAPVEHGLSRAYFRRLALEAPAYLRIFANGWCRTYGTDPEAFRSLLVAGRPLEAADLLSDDVPALDLHDHLSHMDAEGVGLQVWHGVPAEYAERDGDPDPNDRLSKLAGQAPHRLQVWLGISLRHPERAAEAVRSCTRRGFRGLTITPFLDGVEPLDPSCAEIFSAAEEKGLPVWLHTGQHFAAGRPLDLCTWWHVDRLATLHPALTIIVGHGGWPWVQQLTAVAQRHRRVFLELSTHRAHQLTAPGSGWEPLMFAGQGILRSKVLFGSCAAVHTVPVGRLIEEFRELHLDEHIVDAWLFGNARRLLGPSPVDTREDPPSRSAQQA